MTKVLVVDDNRQNLYLLQVLLTGSGFDVATARNGIEALELLRLEPFDLIISDILMPGMDGFQLCREVKTDAQTASIPVVFYTATYTSREDERFGRSLGAAEFLTKPMPPEELIGRVREILDRAHDLSPAFADQPVAAPATDDDELGYLKEYNVRLIQKLEHKLLQLEESEAKYRALFEKSPDGVMIVEPDTGRPIEINEAICEMLSFDRQQIESHTLDSLLIDPHAPSILSRIGDGDEGFECVLRSSAGDPVHVAIRARSINLKSERLLCVLIHDVTERIQAAEALRHSEEQLRQAQKMEAIGRLASGIAHDFNNLLMVINGSCDLLLRRMTSDTQFKPDIEHILQVGEQAAELTRQLLVFARKQRYQSRVIDLAETVAGMETLLRRVLGEDIELSLYTRANPAFVKGDPSQIELVVINLAVNARDAMPNGGRLTIETLKVELTVPMGAVPSGEYVQLIVSDTGSGMDDATKARIFEPFFTTKPPGRGTGLGLATVYGIVKQSDGHIFVDTEVGRGSAFRILLPVTEVESDPILEPALGPLLPRGIETILVVEDQDSVRSVIVDMLIESGYTVFEAANGREALKLAEEYTSDIHLLLTDVVLPGMNGRDVRNLLLETRPGIRSLFMSGHIEDDVLWGKIGNQQSSFLPKPFTLSTLLEKVREVLDRAVT